MRARDVRLVYSNESFQTGMRARDGGERMEVGKRQETNRIRRGGEEEEQSVSPHTMSL